MVLLLFPDAVDVAVEVFELLLSAGHLFMQGSGVDKTCIALIVVDCHKVLSFRF